MVAGSGAAAGRNDPCPCGSGKKYKKCCMGAETPAPAAAEAGAPDPALLLEQATKLHREGRVAMAIELYRDVVARRPKDASARFYLGQALGQLDQRDEAVEQMRRAITLNPKRSLYHSNLAALLLKSGRADESLRAARRAIELDPDDPVSHCTLAGCYERMNKLDEAIRSVERALELDPDDPDSHLVLSGLQRRDKRYTEARALLERFLERDVAAEYRYQAWKELAMVLDKLEAYDEAFEALRQGGLERGRTAEAGRVDRDQAWRRIDGYRATITRDLLARWSPDAFPDRYATPAFLIGFPRSGTTMTEQVMAAHPDVVTSDEKPMVRRVKEAMRSMLGGNDDIPTMLERLDRDQISDLRATYWREAEDIMGETLAGRVFVDKLPLHLIDLPMINVLFPEARVIMALRDPRDVCLSCFTQRFGLNGAMVNFLWWDRTTAFYEKVMDYWLHLKPMITVPFIEMRYEDTVQHLEREARRLLEHLGVPWDDRVLQFYEPARERFISTPSYAAVTEPVHTRAVGRWHNYARHYEPARPHLDRFVKAFGYDLAD